MSVRIVFLGPLRELAREGERAVPAPLGWDGLLEAVGPAIAAQLREGRIAVACAGRVVADATQLAALDGDEVALLPPVSGG